MQNAETVLDVLRERGRRGLPLEGIYRQLFNPQLYLLAYGRIYSNKGAMTPGPDAETADGMTLAKIERIIDAVRHERYRFRPVRRRYIPKKDGKQRPLGLPSWSDKLLGEVIRLLLEAYYEPQFSDHSHGYRPGRGCHTALREVARTWTGTSWFIEGDISQCFDRLDSRVMLETLGEKIHDNRLLRLIGQMLAAGYLEDWVWNATLSGVPQGGVLSPCLSNIYLNRLDRFIETILIPGYNRGGLRRHNPEYQRVQYALARARNRGDHAAVRALRKQQRSLPSHDPHDPGYRRLRYARYADDILLGFTGPKAGGGSAGSRPAPGAARSCRTPFRPRPGQRPERLAVDLRVDRGRSHITVRSTSATCSSDAPSLSITVAAVCLSACGPTGGIPARRHAACTTPQIALPDNAPTGAITFKNTDRHSLRGRRRRYDTSASPTSTARGSRSCRSPLPRTKSSPERQSMSSSVSAATSPARSPSRQHSDTIA